MRLLLLSNSTNAGEKYLDYPKHFIQSFLGDKPVKALFIPYAAVTFSFDEYEAKVRERFFEIGHDIISIHHFESAMDAVLNAKAIVVGGGNTFHLLKLLQDHHIIPIIRERVLKGLPYVGWSAGSNMSCPTICTTNDMPIVAPSGFNAFDLVPFQINPHYTDFIPAGHAGETRDQRIEEFITANPHMTVVGLREGSLFRMEDGNLKLIGSKKIKIFKYGIPPYELDASDELNFLMNR